MTTMAAVDRLMHHSIILEFDGPSGRAEPPATGLKPEHPGNTTSDLADPSGEES